MGLILAVSLGGSCTLWPIVRQGAPLSDTRLISCLVSGSSVNICDGDVVNPLAGPRSAGSATATAAILDQPYSDSSLRNKTRFPMPSWSKRRCMAYGGGNLGTAGMGLVTAECAGHGACTDDGTCDCVDGYEGRSAL